jgi:hypothetical protein
MVFEVEGIMVPLNISNPDAQNLYIGYFTWQKGFADVKKVSILILSCIFWWAQ